MKVYAILNKINNKVKIGTANNPEERLRQLQTGNSDPLILAAVINANERQLHQRFRRYHFRGEWFEYSREVENFFKEAVYRETEEGKRKEEEGIERKRRKKEKESKEIRERAANIRKECREYIIDLKKEFPLGWERMRKADEKWAKKSFFSSGRDKDGFTFIDSLDKHGEYHLWWRGEPLLAIGTYMEKDFDNPSDELSVCKARLRKVYKQYHDHKSRWRYRLKRWLRKK